MMDIDDAILEDQMLKDQNLDDRILDIDDFGTPSTLKSTTNINLSTDRTSTVNKVQNVKGKGKKKISSSATEDTENVDNKRVKSKVWGNFERVGLVGGVEKAQCKYCDRFYTCQSSYDTTHLKHHSESCHKTPKFHNVGAMLDNQATLLKK
ncbi:hypothetical protein C2S51_038310 [Perilla frutescens var. frutescens]|nr:hypothetical protein C2S51_038310 [Perilla frutescens var. frutescens]